MRAFLVLLAVTLAAPAPARSKALADNDKSLAAHIEKELARPRRDDRYFSYRILREPAALSGRSTVTEPGRRAPSRR